MQSLEQIVTTKRLMPQWNAANGRFMDLYSLQNTCTNSPFSIIEAAHGMVCTLYTSATTALWCLSGTSILSRGWDSFGNTPSIHILILNYSIMHHHRHSGDMADGSIVLVYVNSPYNLANIGTEYLASADFKREVSMSMSDGAYELSHLETLDVGEISPDVRMAVLGRRFDSFRG